MLEKISLIFMAIVSGVLLALMINLNSELAATTSAFQASWIAHGVGGGIAFLLYIIFIHRCEKPAKESVAKKYWFGGIPGAFTVVLASVTVNSDIGLTGTLALALIGQFMLSLFIEHFGLLNQATVKLCFKNVFPTFLVAIGALIIIYGKV